MKFGATLNTSLLTLLESGRIDVDYIEVNGEHDMDQLRRALALRPVILHDIAYQFWLNYADPFVPAMMEKARAMIDLARPPWHSTGIGASAEPQGHTTKHWRGAPPEALQTREVCLANIRRNARRLQAWLGPDLPLLLENYNYHPTNAYEYVCEPETFSATLEDLGLDMLLDLAHAQISARNMRRGDARAYLAQLPLDKVREIHINHPFDDGTQMLDRHMPIEPVDIDLLRWTLERTPRAEAITLESHGPSEEALAAEVALLRAMLGRD